MGNGGKFGFMAPQRRTGKEGSSGYHISFALLIVKKARMEVSAWAKHNLFFLYPFLALYTGRGEARPSYPAARLDTSEMAERRQIEKVGKQEARGGIYRLGREPLCLRQ